jgi:hypothetical protein
LFGAGLLQVQSVLGLSFETRRRNDLTKRGGKHENSFVVFVLYWPASVFAASPFRAPSAPFYGRVIFAFRRCRRQRLGAKRVELRHYYLPAASRHQLHVQRRYHTDFLSSDSF